mgnify:CR=1 FL=1|tara:strand:+ start:55 stop:420 length:366 start_codon:yes stop_codon:yes gene_type:complete
MITEIFTWWNRQTLGTRVWSYLNGFQVGEDLNGNKYFSNKSDTKRWVIYGEQVEATNVSPEWNNWLRFTSIEKPKNIKRYDWQKDHIQNQTGTSNAYSPQNSFDNKDHEKKIDYDRWSPKD